MNVKEQYSRLVEDYKEESNKCRELKESYMIGKETIKNMEIKVEEYKKRVMNLANSNKKYIKELTLIKPKYEYLTEEVKRLGGEYKALSDKIIILVKANNNLEETIKKLNEQLNNSNIFIKSKNEELAAQKIELERYELKARSLEQDVIIIEGKKNATEKEAITLQALLQEKINILTESLNAETNNNQALFLRYSNEEKEHVQTKRVHSKGVAKLEDIELQLKNSKDLLQRKIDSIFELTEERNVLRSKVENIEAECKVLKVDKGKAEELIRKLEDYYKNKLLSKSNKKKRMREEHRLKLERMRHTYEDLCSRFIDSHQLLNEYINKVFTSL